MRRNPVRWLAATALVAAIWAAPAHAQIVQAFVGGSIFPSFAGDGDTVGYSFQSTTSVRITHLGFWDNPADGVPIVLSHAVGIWTNAGTLLASTTVTPTSPLTGAFRYEPLALAVLLAAGTEYVLGAYYDAANPLTDGYTTGTTAQTLASGFSLVSTRRDPDGAVPALAFPSVATAIGGRFGPNALFAPVPEPSSMALVAVGVSAAALRLRRRAAKV